MKFPIYGKIKNVPNHQPVRYFHTVHEKNNISFGIPVVRNSSHPYWLWWSLFEKKNRMMIAIYPRVNWHRCGTSTISMTVFLWKPCYIVVFFVLYKAWLTCFASTARRTWYSSACVDSSVNLAAVNVRAVRRVPSSRDGSRKYWGFQLVMGLP